MPALSSTLEMRWFLPGQIDLEVADWFEHRCPGQPLSAQTRTDRYLQMPSCETVSIKLREGRFEVKWRQQALGLQVYAKQRAAWLQQRPLEGQLEQWHKLSYSDLFATQQPMPPATPARWLAVHKHRQLRSAQNVQIELVQLTLKQQPWWSLSLEAALSPAAQQRLNAIAQQISETYPGPTLLATQSQAFPAWLLQIETAL
ncbi:MAG: hypothetical protein F6J97_03795 [Leptolyngbya sp. SIO4C1]|nr:hypothetical protein [Leptolyngbya sp. SIO4C1]